MPRRAAPWLRRAASLAALVAAIGCTPPSGPAGGGASPIWVGPTPIAQVVDPTAWGEVAHATDDLVFDGGRLHFEMRRAGDRVLQVVRNDYAVPVTIAWALRDLDNLQPLGLSSGSRTLPAAAGADAPGTAVVLTELRIVDPGRPWYRYLDFRARFGDPAARPDAYAYALPFGVGQERRIIQGFGGAFSHQGSNYYAIDFDCPEGTPVLAARDGLVVATHDQAVGNGTTADWMDYQRVNFVVILHDDGTLGEYMHLAPGGVRVKAGQRVRRAEFIAVSGNTGFSSTPHLHFKVMTAAPDGLEAVSFPFELEVAPGRAEPPTEGRTYRAYERVRLH